MILLMLRGRHRGLPTAIDRAIMLPKVFSRIGKDGEVGAKDAGAMGKVVVSGDMYNAKD